MYLIFLQNNFMGLFVKFEKKIAATFRSDGRLALTTITGFSSWCIGAHEPV